MFVHKHVISIPSCRALWSLLPELNSLPALEDFPTLQISLETLTGLFQLQALAFQVASSCSEAMSFPSSLVFH